MARLKLSFAATCILLASFCAQGQESGAQHQTTVEWRLHSQLSEAVGGTSQPGIAGSFLGVHNDALIIAGGVDENHSDTVRVATRDTGADRNGDGTISPDEVAVTWHDTGLRLPGKRAFGVSGSHAFGVFAIGGTDGTAISSDVLLIRWNGAASLFRLPPLPVASVHGGLAVIGDTLYVLTGNGEAEPGRALYALDLSRIETDTTGTPLANDGNIRLTAGPADPWQKLPSLPLSAPDDSRQPGVAVVAQDSGRGGRLYVIASRHGSTELWEYDPGDDAAAWQRKADVSTNGQTVDLNGGSAVALGQSHILLVTGPGDNGIRRALSYNTIADVWAAYNDAPPLAGDGAATTHAVHWGSDIVLASGSTTAEESGFWTIGVQGPELTFGWLNMTVLVIYLLSMVMVGVYFVFKNSDTNDYFRGGQNIPWWAAACSIYATMLSSLTYVALPALVYRTDWLIYIGTMMILAVAPIAIYVAMPFFRQIDATSAYEYLSKRFNMPVRLFASGLFSLFHIGRMGIVLALTALALAAVTPLDPWQSVLIMGVLSVIYCTLGGVEAVIWTDTIQTVVLLIGALLCFTIIMGGVDGGFSGFIDTGMADDKFKMVKLDFGPGSITTLSIWVIVLGGLGQNISSYTADQAVVQRYMTTKDTHAAAKSIWMNGIMAVPGALLFFCIGTGLYAFYKSQPEKLDPTIQIDQIFPTFIGVELPVGIAGIIVAGIFAAAQSTVSTSMNSIATTVVTDFMRPFNACKSERSYLNAARLLTFTMGVLGTLAGLLFISPEIRSLMEEYFK
ncbi:MAG: sodium:solute symporter family transporter, partial [Woeseiaceae bacterium]